MYTFSKLPFLDLFVGYRCNRSPFSEEEIKTTPFTSTLKALLGWEK